MVLDHGRIAEDGSHDRTPGPRRPLRGAVAHLHGRGGGARGAARQRARGQPVRPPAGSASRSADPPNGAKGWWHPRRADRFSPTFAIPRGGCMRKATRWLLSLAVLIGTAGAGSASAGAATAAEPKTRGHQGPDPRDTGDEPHRREAGRRLPLLRPELHPAIDHRHPAKGTFQQRLTLLHKSVDRPTVFFTSGYNVSTTPSRSEPTKIIDGNQVSLEYRYFTPSRPTPDRLEEAGHPAGRQRPAPPLPGAAPDLRPRTGSPPAAARAA